MNCVSHTAAIKSILQSMSCQWTNATQSYRIIAMEAKNKVRSRREEVHLYASTTAHWRKLCEVPDKYRAYSSVFLRGVLYTLFLDSSLVPWCPKLYSCDLETGAWSYIDVELPQPSCLQARSLLVVSLGRLFFVEYTGVPIFPSNRMTTWETLLASSQVKKKQLIKVSILEILHAEREVIKVAEMPKYSKYPRTLLDENRPQTGIGDTVVAVGCGDSIVISSLLAKGRRVGFDLLKNCWHELPVNTGHMLDSTHRGASRQGISAGLVDLDLREMSSRTTGSQRNEHLVEWCTCKGASCLTSVPLNPSFYGPSGIEHNQSPFQYIDFLEILWFVCSRRHIS